MPRRFCTHSCPPVSGGILSRLTGQPVHPPVLAPTGGGLTARVLTVGGPLLVATGIAYSLASGDPPDKALLVAGVSFPGAVGGMAVVMLISSTPPAWALGLGAVLGGFLASQGAGWAHDALQPASEKLRRWSVDMDPGPTELPG